MSPQPGLASPLLGGLSWGLGVLCGQVRGQPRRVLRPPPIHKACGSTWGAPRARPEGSRLERRRAVLTGRQTTGWAAEQGPCLPDGELQELGCLCSWAWDAGRPSQDAWLARAPQGRPSPLSPAPTPQGCHRSVPGPQRRPWHPGQTARESGPCSRLTGAAQAQRAARARASWASKKASREALTSPPAAACGLGSQPAQAPLPAPPPLSG